MYRLLFRAGDSILTAGIYAKHVFLCDYFCENMKNYLFRPERTMMTS